MRAAVPANMCVCLLSGGGGVGLLFDSFSGSLCFRVCRALVCRFAAQVYRFFLFRPLSLREKVAKSVGSCDSPHTPHRKVVMRLLRPGNMQRSRRRMAHVGVLRTFGKKGATVQNRSGACEVEKTLSFANGCKVTAGETGCRQAGSNGAGCSPLRGGHWAVDSIDRPRY